MLLSTKEAAVKLGFCRGHIRLLIRCGKLKAKKVGSDYVIEEKNIKSIVRRRSPNGEKRTIG